MCEHILEALNGQCYNPTVVSTTITPQHIVFAPYGLLHIESESIRGAFLRLRYGIVAGADADGCLCLNPLRKDRHDNRSLACI